MKRKSTCAAVIDCGTNTFNLLIAQFSDSGWKSLLRTKRVVKLGAQGLSHGILGPEAQQRAIDALLYYRILLSEHRVKNVSVIGTAALRDAKNGKEFLSRVLRETGFNIRLVTGKEEAKLIYEGVKSSGVLNDACALIMDIGGGSTEFILCSHTKIYWKHSFRLGAARLIEAIDPSDPISKKDLVRMYDLLGEQLEPLFKACKRFPPERLVGSSGSFDTFTSLIQGERNLKPARKKHQEISDGDWKKLYARLLASTLAARLKMPGMIAMRADMIVMAACLVEFVRKETGLKKIHQCKYALKEGVIASLYNANS